MLVFQSMLPILESYKSYLQTEAEIDLAISNPEYAKVAYLRNFQTMDIAKIGDADTKMILAEYGLEMSNEAAHGIVADLTA